MTRANDLLGQRFGRLVVIERSSDEAGLLRWKCRCDCGRETSARANWLRTGNTKSCGCLGVEARALAAAAVNTTHGMSRTGTYEVWVNMKRRCMDPTHKSYGDYGGRGITVCERWRDSFEAFLADIGERPEGLTIERNDVNGPYALWNCRWAPMREQYLNRTDTRWLTCFGETKAAAAWLLDPRCTVNAASLYKRLANGWSDEHAITRPMRCQSNRRAKVEAAKP